VSGDLSESEVIGRGARQGYFLTTLLFSLYVEETMEEGIDDTKVQIGCHRLGDVRFADDQER